MNSTNILSYTNRLVQGENPTEVFTEIEIFYVIRDFLNRLDPGNCRHALDEYDSEAQHLLNYFIDAHSVNKIITSNELADYVEEYFFKRFNRIQTENMKSFASFLFQEILILRTHKIRGKDLSKTLIQSELED
jgi:hypothetical protein